MPLRGGRAVFAARSDPLRRPLQTPGRERRQNLLGKRATLGAKSAADVLGDDAHTLFLEAERARDRLPDAEDVLRRGPHLKTVGFRIGAAVAARSSIPAPATRAVVRPIRAVTP